MIVCLGTTPARQRTLSFASLTIDGVNRATSVFESASGKVLNVARVLRALGAASIATGFLGGGAGEFMRRDMDAAGIRHDFVPVDPETRTCTTLLDERARTATELIEEAEAVPSIAWQMLATKLEMLLRDSKVLVCSGTIAPGGADSFYAECARRATEAGVLSIVDASGTPLRMALEARPYIVKPNRSELGKTLDMNVDSDASLRDAMKRTIDHGAGWVVVTLGAAGAVASNGDEFWRVEIPTVPVVNPIGSGDSFAAGLAAGVDRGQDVRNALRLAAACGVANTMTPIAGFVRRDDVEALFGQVELEKWR